MIPDLPFTLEAAVQLLIAALVAGSILGLAAVITRVGR